MTIIALSGRAMAADSVSWTGGMHEPCTVPKILRTRYGTLVGASGAVSDICRVFEWFDNYKDRGAFPVGREEGDNELDFLMLRPDGSAWRGNRYGDLVPRGDKLSVIGVAVAADFVYGLMTAGVGLREAVAMAIERCGYLGGEVQYEELA